MYDNNSIRTALGRFSRAHQSAGRLLVPICAAVAAVGLPAPAQEAVKEPNWTAVRKTDLAAAAIERPTVQRWLDAQVQQLLTSEDVPAVQSAASGFYKKMMEQFSATDSVQAFKDRLADLLAGSFTKQYQPNDAAAKPPHPLGTSSVLMVLRDAPRPTALPCFRAALKDPTPGPRFVAAEGLLAIRQSLTAQDWTGLIPDLQKAAIREGNNPALTRIYRLLFAAAEDNARAGLVVSAILAILDSRSSSFEKSGRMPLRADGEALVWLSNNAKGRTDTVRRAAHLLADAVYSCLNDKPDKDHQEQLEWLIVQVEPRLETLARLVDHNFKAPEATVWAALKTLGAGREKKTTAALAQWIGSGQTPGVLNKPPFAFPVELGIARKPPATAPASAPAGA